jgi:hypothetical protein
MDKLIFESEFINKKLVSINNGYYLRAIRGKTPKQDRVMKTKNKEAKEFQRYVYGELCDKIKLDNTSTYKIVIDMHINLQNSDVDNRFKFLLDVIENVVNGAPWDYSKAAPFNKEGFNDKQFIRVEGEKYKVKRDFQGFKFYIYEYEEDKNKSLPFKFNK